MPGAVHGMRKEHSDWLCSLSTECLLTLFLSQLSRTGMCRKADYRRGRPWPAAGSPQGTKIQAESLFSTLNPPGISSRLASAIFKLACSHFLFHSAGSPKRPIPVSIDKQSAGLLTSTKQRPEVGAKYSTAQAAKRLKR